MIKNVLTACLAVSLSTLLLACGSSGPTSQAVNSASPPAADGQADDSKSTPCQKSAAKEAPCEKSKADQAGCDKSKAKKKGCCGKKKQSSATENGDSSQGKPCTGSQEKKACCGGQSAGGQKKSPCDTPATEGSGEKEAPCNGGKGPSAGQDTAAQDDVEPKSAEKEASTAQ